MFLASNCTCAVYFTYTAHVQLLAKNMAATHVYAIFREDNPLYVFTLCPGHVAGTCPPKQARGSENVHDIKSTPEDAAFW